MSEFIMPILGEQPAAIVRQNLRPIDDLARDCNNGFIATVAQAQLWLKNHEELKSRYKEKWATWEDACQAVYHCSRQAVHKKLSKILEDVSSTEVDTALDSLPPADHINDPPKPKFRPESKEPAPPAPQPPEDNHKPEPNEPSKPASDNGKPKFLLPIWTELTQKLIGWSLNRLDVLNNQCPNPQRHADALAKGKAYLTSVEQWRDSLK